jgi:hypothetical protein
VVELSDRAAGWITCGVKTLLAKPLDCLTIPDDKG